MNRISIVCLGVRDMERSVRFYRDGLGFQTDEKSNNPAIIFFNTFGTKFELYPLEKLVEDIDPASPSTINNGFCGFTLAYNVKSMDDVDKTIEIARNAGAKILKKPVVVFWGGYHGYFSDPDGYVWEVAWGPDFKYDKDEMLIF